MADLPVIVRVLFGFIGAWCAAAILIALPLTVLLGVLVESRYGRQKLYVAKEGRTDAP